MSEQLNFPPLLDDAHSLGLFTINQWLVLRMFQSAMESYPEHTPDEIAITFRSSIIAAAKEERSRGQDVAFEGDTCTALIIISTYIPCQHYGQDVLTRTICLLNDGGWPLQVLQGLEKNARECWNHSPSTPSTPVENIYHVTDL